MSNNNPSEANPSGVESLNGQEENRTVEKHMSSTGTGGDGGFDAADEVKDWNFNALISGDELITGDEQEGMAARSGDGGLGMESQERSSIPDETGEVPLTALSVLSLLPAANLREKAEQPQVRNCFLIPCNEVLGYFEYIAVSFLSPFVYPTEVSNNAVQ